MDRVLIDSMPYHAEAMYQALKLEIDYELDKKWIYLLEGMPAESFLYEIFKRNPPNQWISKEITAKIIDLKKKIFKEIENIKLMDGTKELLDSLNKTNCIKAIVGGSSRKEAHHIIEKKIGIKNFDIIITGDDAVKGKPNHQLFTTELKEAKLE